MPFAARERGVAKWQRRAEMPDRKNPGTSDYVVGYRRPPKATAKGDPICGWQKRQSEGTPKGALLKDILQQKIAVTENGKTRRTPRLK